MSQEEKERQDREAESQRIREEQERQRIWLAQQAWWFGR